MQFVISKNVLKNPMMQILQLLSAFLLGLGLVYYSIPVIVRISHDKHLFDVPNERKVNKKIVPNLGGIALFIGITLDRKSVV